MIRKFEFVTKTQFLSDKTGLVWNLVQDRYWISKQSNKEKAPKPGTKLMIRVPQNRRDRKPGKPWLYFVDATGWEIWLKGSVREKWQGYRLTAINNRFWSLLILLLSVASVWRKLLKTSHTEVGIYDLDRKKSN